MSITSLKNDLLAIYNSAKVSPMTEETFALQEATAIVNNISGSSGIVSAVNGMSGDVILDQDDISDGATYGRFTLARITDLTDAGDSTLHYHATDRARATHTGTQAASTISDFDTEVSNNTDVSANTSARHSAVTVVDTSTVNLILNGQAISGVVLPGGVDHNQLLNYASNRHFLQSEISIPASQISDFDVEVSNNSTVVAKITNAIHIGDVAGSGILSITNNAVTLAKLATQGANTLLANATTGAAVPSAVAIAEQNVVGRLTGGNIAGISIGIADNNLVQIDSVDVGSGEYVRWTANGVEGRTVAELSLEIGASLSGIPSSLLTEQGDIIYASAPNTASSLSHGSYGQVLKTGGNAANPRWDWYGKSSGVVANYVFSTTDGVSDLLVTTGATNKYVTLPPRSANIGRKIKVQKVDSGAGQVYFSGLVPDTINGTPWWNITEKYGWVEAVADNSEWRAVSDGNSTKREFISAASEIINTTTLNTWSNFPTSHELELTAGTWRIDFQVGLYGAITTGSDILIYATLSTTTAAEDAVKTWTCESYVNQSHAASTWAIIGFFKKSGIVYPVATTIYYLNAKWYSTAGTYASFSTRGSVQNTIIRAWRLS